MNGCLRLCMCMLLWLLLWLAGGVGDGVIRMCVCLCIWHVYVDSVSCLLSVLGTTTADAWMPLLLLTYVVFAREPSTLNIYHPSTPPAGAAPLKTFLLTVGSLVSVRPQLRTIRRIINDIAMQVLSLWL